MNEGYTVIAPYFPFFYDVILINVEQKNQDFSFDNLRCNAQGQFQGSASVQVKVGITWQPDTRGERLYNYVGVGNEQGTWNILRDMLAEALRQYVAPRPWQELAHAGGEITQTLLQKLTGQSQPATAANGHADILGLGIIITRLNVGEIIPVGRTVEGTENAADTEILLQTAVMLKKAYEQAGERRSLDECMVEARRLRTTQTGGGNFVDVPGLAGMMQGLGRR
ncbi:SPFH domain-containing protein [Methylomagnum sp.]